MSLLIVNYFSGITVNFKLSSKDESMTQAFVNVIILFSSSLTRKPDTLECLSLPSFSRLFQYLRVRLEWSIFQVLPSKVGVWSFTHKYYTWLLTFTSDKHLAFFVSDKEKRFITFTDNLINSKEDIL